MRLKKWLATRRQVNERTENIGARRLHTIMEKAARRDFVRRGRTCGRKTVKIDAAYVRKQLAGIVKDQDLLSYIL